MFKIHQASRRSKHSRVHGSLDLGSNSDQSDNEYACPPLSSQTQPAFTPPIRYDSWIMMCWRVWCRAQMQLLA